MSESMNTLSRFPSALSKRRVLPWSSWPLSSVMALEATSGDRYSQKAIPLLRFVFESLIILWIAKKR